MITISLIGLAVALALVFAVRPHLGLTAGGRALGFVARIRWSRAHATSVTCHGAVHIRREHRAGDRTFTPRPGSSRSVTTIVAANHGVRPRAEARC